MPCRYDDPSSPEEREADRFRSQGTAAVLCGVFSRWEADGTFEVNFAKIDWKEVGWDPAVAEQWWVKHKIADLERRQREKTKAEKQLERDRKEYIRLKKQFEGK